MPKVNSWIWVLVTGSFLLAISLLALSLAFGPGRYCRVGRIALASRLGAPGPYRVVSYTLFGSQHRYTKGIIENARSIGIHFPGWVMRVYTKQSSVPISVFHELMEFPWVDIIPVSLPADMASKLWRFAPALQKPLEGTRVPDAVMVRDCDSIAGSRDARTVKAWLRSGLPLHIIRDHPLHRSCGRPVLAGLWGATGELLTDKCVQKEFAARVPHRKGQEKGYAADELFLMKWLYPRYRSRAFVTVSKRHYLWPGEKLGQLMLPDVSGEYLGQILWR